MHLRSLAAVLAVFAALATAFRYRHLVLRQNIGDRFERIDSGVLRQPYIWHKAPGFSVEVHCFMFDFERQGGKDYVLVDAGAPIEEQERFLLNALEKDTADGSLSLILLTHGHSDHVGALRAVARKYKDVQIAFHEEEAQFLLGNVSYNSLPGAPGGVTDYSVQDVLPTDRVLLLRGDSGDVADAKSLSGHPPRWLPPRGVVSYHLLPGHTPGQVAFLHAPSRALLLADVLKNAGGLDLPYVQFTANMTEARESAMKLSTLDYKLALVSHDEEPGVTKSRIDDLLRRLATEQAAGESALA